MKNLQNQFSILIIENDSDWLPGISSTLKAAGYAVSVVRGGDRGFCVARRARPDLILCETEMPNISGIQLCYMLRADRQLAKTQIILLGAEDNRSGDYAFEGLRAGADDYFGRNGSRELLAVKVAKLIDRRRGEIALRQRCRNLRRSERHLSKIVEDAFNLVNALTPAARPASAADEDSPPANFFNRRESPATPKKSPPKNAEGLEKWQRSLQPKQPAAAKAHCFTSNRREKVYYEIVC